MSTPAKALAAADVRRLLAHVRRGRCPVRDQVIVMLSFKAGLRACEIAGLDWTMVLAAGGKISQSLFVSGNIAKYGRSRHVPLHRELQAQLRRLHVEAGRPRAGAVIVSRRGGPLRARSIVNWIFASS